MTKMRTKATGIEERAEAMGVERKVTEKGMRQVPSTPGGDLGLTMVQLGHKVGIEQTRRTGTGIRIQKTSP